MYSKNEIDAQAEREGVALKQQGRYMLPKCRWVSSRERQGRYTQSRWLYTRLQDDYKKSIERKHFKG